MCIGILAFLLTETWPGELTHYGKPICFKRPTRLLYLHYDFFQGPVLAVTEGEGSPCIFNTEFEAQREIVDLMIIRLNEFLEGQRDFSDAITTEEYVVPVTALADGSIIDEAGRHFGKK